MVSRSETPGSALWEQAEQPKGTLTGAKGVASHTWALASLSLRADHYTLVLTGPLSSFRVALPCQK